jgi:hypothetical protein
VLAAVGVGVIAAARDDPAPTPLETVDQPAPGWHRILKADAGIDQGASLDGIASDGDTALLAGAVVEGDYWHARLWWSEDGLTWHEAEHPDVGGSAFAVAIHDDVALAAGTNGTDADPYQGPFVWRSEDRGRTWSDVDLPVGELGPDASEMGRPFITEMRWFNGWWVAAGGSSTGYAAIWVSTDGQGWDQVLESREAGGVGLLELPGDRVAAYAFDVVWVTDDPTDWGDPIDADVAPDLYPISIARGAALAVAESLESHTDRRVLRSNDEGRTWVVDESFTGAFPTSAFQFGDLQLVTGADRQSRPTAWVATPSGWDASPEDLRGPPGGVLILAQEVDGRIVVFGTAPELDRFYVLAP